MWENIMLDEMAGNNPYRVKARAISQAIYEQYAPQSMRLDVRAIGYIKGVDPPAVPTVVIINLREYNGTHFTVNLTTKWVKDCFADVHMPAPVEIHGIMDDLVEVARRDCRGDSIDTPEDHDMWLAQEYVDQLEQEQGEQDGSDDEDAEDESSEDENSEDSMKIDEVMAWHEANWHEANGHE